MDWYDSSFWNKGAMLDPVNLSKQGKRVLRGGSWLNNYPVYFRCADRGRDYPDNWLYFGGFRVVFEDFFSYPLPFYSFTLFSSCRRCEESKFLFLRCVLVGFSPHHQPLLPSLGEEANARKLKGFLVVCKPEDRYFGNISRDCF